MIVDEMMKRISMMKLSQTIKDTGMRADMGLETKGRGMSRSFRAAMLTAFMVVGLSFSPFIQPVEARWQ